MRPDLSKFDNSWYHPGGSSLLRLCWYYVNLLVFVNPLNPLSSLKVRMLRLFGATIGKGVVIKPGVNIKYPWRLKVGDYCWIGERVWIDNLDQVTLANNVCLSQGAMLLCGNHDYKKDTFDLVIAPIELGDGAWIGAQATVCPGTIIEAGAIVSVGSVAVGRLAADSIYQGIPAVLKRKR